ncbi:MAG: hypothetical protein HYX27_03185 [Acidobacteria bacterium]|nr:hypothetical protein [Acidobacteriota bacterium]
MNSTGKFLVSALLVHAANMKKASDTQSAIPVPQGATSVTANQSPQAASNK